MKIKKVLCKGVWKMMTKYRNKITVVDGIKFASKKEAKRYGELKLLEKAGEITNLTLQPKFLLQEGYKWISQTCSRCGLSRAEILNIDELSYDCGCAPKDIKKETFTVRPVYYIADFKYTDKGHNCVIVEDAKGKKTDVYEIKRKMFLRLYGNKYVFREV